MGWTEMNAELKGLISTTALEKLIGNPYVKILDCTYNHPASFEDSPRIVGARAFDIDAIANLASNMPHMLPSTTDFGLAMEALGVSNHDFVIVYDRFNIAMAASRAWWMFRVFGHDNVVVLNGGLGKWIEEGRQIVSGFVPPAKQGNFRADYRTHLVRDFQSMKENVSSKIETVIDARDSDRFSGRVQESRQGLGSGHIPHSKNIPYASLINPDGTLKSEKELKDVFTKSCIDLDSSIVATCGSGVTACVSALALYQLGEGGVAVYDGSWAEWGRHSELIEKG